MTKKQIQILDTAIELFLTVGFNATTSKLISKNAQVSEGLIFKHFKDKNGLLNAVIDYCDEDLIKFLTKLQYHEDYKFVLHQIIELPILLHTNSNNKLQLLFKLKYELKLRHSKALSLLNDLLINVFKHLNYKYPEIENELVNYYLLGLTHAWLFHSVENIKTIKNNMLNKYHLI